MTNIDDWLSINEGFISVDECEDGFLYKVDARNFSLGVYNEHQKGFIGIRQKFKMIFLDLEYHWDTGAPYGTVKPIKKIKKCPIKFDRMMSVNDRKFDENKKLFNWLKKESGDKHE